jgi:hypothetical protein
MAVARFADRVRQPSVTTGTGNITLQTPETGFVSFASEFATNEDLAYVIEGLNAADEQTGQWEIGRGYLNGSGALVRDTLFASSTMAFVNFTAAKLRCFVATSADALTEWVDALIAAAVTQLQSKGAVRLTALTLPAFTAAGAGVGKTLTANANGALTVDGVAVALNDRIGYIAVGAHAGIFTVSQVGSGGAPWILTRATDADGTPSGEFKQGLYFNTLFGATLAGHGYLLATPNPIVLDTTVLTFQEFSVSSTSVPSASTANKNMTATVTTVDNDQATVTAVAENPALGGYVGVAVGSSGGGKLLYQVGDGTKVGVPCYFSGDGGVTARTMSGIVTGDTLHWNQSVAGFNLTATMRIDFLFESY